jgi:hypothetical protein
MKYRDPKPDILRIEELVKDVKSGDIKLPKFQRPFVWNKEDILKLLDSVYQGYPIGSVLLWLTREKLAAERKIADLEINERPDEYPTNYLLDGQQRLSTLCGALYWNGEDKNSIWNIAFDVEAETFLHPKGTLKITEFPLNKIINTSDFLAQCRAFDALDQKDLYYKRAERLLNSIKDYKIAAVRIGDMSLDEVAPIFERINSSGRQLTMVDLMRAATWKGGFDLNDAIDSVRSACEEKNFFDIKELHILRSISAAAGLGIHKEDVERLRDKTSDELKTAASRSVEAYKLAVDFLTSELPLTSINYLPYALQLTYIVEFFNLCPAPTSEQRAKLKLWFWLSSFSRQYGSSNTGLISSDLKLVRSFANGEIDGIPVSSDLNEKNILEDSFALNKATSMTYALLLAHKKPKSLLDGSVIDIRKALAVTNRLEYHHIFPKAHLERNGVSKDKANIHLNICMLNLTNNREISDKNPSDYFLMVEDRLGTHLDEVLNSNYINHEAFKAAKSSDYEKFIAEREKELAKEIKILTQ